jgi:hypothetical protein
MSSSSLLRKSHIAVGIGLGICVTRHMVNAHCYEDGGELVRLDSIWQTVHRLQPVVERTPVLLMPGSHAYTRASVNLLTAVVIPISADVMPTMLLV